MDHGTRELTTVARAFEVLDVLEDEQGAGPAAVAERMGVTRSTAHDYLTSLEATGYVTSDGGEYRVGYRFLQRGSRLKFRNRLFHAAKFTLGKLAEDSGELAQIGVEEGGEWVMLHEDADFTSVNMGTYPGLRAPLYSHAAGKVLLAHLPEERRESILGAVDLDPVTEATVTDPADLAAELARIREQGYGVDWNEQVLGIGFVACPVHDGDDLLGSVSVACPTGRLQRVDYRDTLVQHVRAAADEIAINYRYH